VDGSWIRIRTVGSSGTAASFKVDDARMTSAKLLED